MLDGSPEVLSDVAMANIFWLSVYGVHIGATYYYYYYYSRF